MGRRKIWIKEQETFGEEIDYTLSCSDNNAFLKTCNDDNLQRLLETQLTHENYEMAELIKKEIELRNGL